MTKSPAPRPPAAHAAAMPIPWPLVTLVLGIGIGVWLGRDSGSPPPPPPTPTVVAPKAGELRKLDDKEAAELAARKAGKDTAIAASASSPYMAETVTRDLAGDVAKLGEWNQAVGAMEQGNARLAKPILARLEGEAAGRSFQDAVQVLLAEARINTGEVDSGRALLATWRGAFPGSPFQAHGYLAEGKASMQDARRNGPERSPGQAPSEAQRALYQKALGSWERAIADFPRDPATADALFHKVAILGELADVQGAERAAQQLVSSFPDSRHAPRALANAARIATDARDHERAERLYRTLSERYPQDRLAQNARTQLQGLKVLGKPAPALDVSEWVGPAAGTLESLRGKVVVLVFWATWCPHCRKAMPTVEEDLWKKWKDKGVTVIAVTRNTKGQTTESVRQYIDENGYTVPVAIDAGGTSRAYGVSGIPASAIIDKEGRIVFQDHPSRIDDALIQGLLGA